jgi:4-carboxymuconolactone decarboxylase
MVRVPHMSAETSERLPLLAPDMLREDQRKVYEAVVGGPRAEQSSFGVIDDDRRLLGPYNAMLYSPAVGMSLQELGASVRFRTGFTPREREIAILTVAAYWRSDYIWYAHQRVGRDAGLSENELEALRVREDPGFTDVHEHAIYTVVTNLMQASDLDDGIYAECQSDLGHVALVELTTLVGYYTTLALQLRVFRVGAPASGFVPD